MGDPVLRPCPFCGESSATPFDKSDTEVVVACDVCLAEGPVATLGCRDEDEDGEIDLEAEAIELWNQRKFGVVP